MKLIKLDEFQEPTREYEGNALLNSGPGAGKSRTVAAKQEYLRKVKNVPLSDMLDISFSRMAARELTDRMPALKNRIMTIHAFSKRLVEQRRGTKLRIVNQVREAHIFDERKGIICEFLDKPNFMNDVPLGLEIAQQRMWLEERQLQKEVGDLLNAIDLCRARPDTGLPMWCTPAYNHYQATLKKMGKIDFNDMLTLAIEELDKRPEYVKWLFVDEGHDTSMLQYEIVKRIIAEHVWWVHDPHQMMYRWNGADERNYQRFKADYNPKEFSLLNNWRSTPEIVEVLETIYPRGLVPKNTGDSKVEYHRVDVEDQFEAAIDIVKRHESHEILARTNWQISSSNGWKKRLKEDYDVDLTAGTIHWSKGSQAEAIVVLGAEYPYLPLKRSTDIREERNLMYVACSRAKRYLHILFESYPTEFLDGYEAETTEYKSRRFG